ncbi:hypothetical protein EVAR_18708_1 [Eumeta japonica]|uniref:Uncharacterized protein n=1 Tax=Eumeta variegata TaxID=151549 RepID=A0A4C1U875_EUMVA|nr:hypothetical protein EVAR_18708_1 [Eumeta japonica]
MKGLDRQTDGRTDYEVICFSFELSELENVRNNTYAAYYLTAAYYKIDLQCQPLPIFFPFIPVKSYMFDSTSVSSLKHALDILVIYVVGGSAVVRRCKSLAGGGGPHLLFAFVINTVFAPLIYGSGRRPPRA